MHRSASGTVISDMAGYDLNNAIMDISTYANSIGWLLWVCGTMTDIWVGNLCHTHLYLSDMGMVYKNVWI